MAVIGETGTGKTFLASHLLRNRQDWIITFKSKADDTRILGKEIRSYEGMHDLKERRFVLYPSYENQLAQFSAALETVWRERNWLVYLDELYGLTQLGKPLQLRINRLLTQGRSKKITVMMGMQRPVSVSRFALSQATHVLCFAVEGRESKIVAETTSPRVRDPIDALQRHQFLWYYRPERRFWIGRVQDLYKEID